MSCTCKVFSSTSAATMSIRRSSRRTRSGLDLDHKFSAKVPKMGDESGKVFALLACGSFNPITNMHLRMFEVARNYLISQFPKCQVLKGIVSPVSDAYGKKGLEESKHRLKMCKLAVKSNDWVEISSWESTQDSWTPTVKVLEKMQKTLRQQNASTQLLLLCGSDLLESFAVPGLWKDADIKTIVSEFGLMVLQRPGYSAKVEETHEMVVKYRENIHMVDDQVNNNTSSTSVRKLLRTSLSIKYLVPDNVVQYISKHNLYSSEESENKNANIELKPMEVNRDI